MTFLYIILILKEKNMNIEITNIDNLTEDEKKTLKTLIEKGNSTPKEVIFKPDYEQEYYIITSEGAIFSVINECSRFDDLRFRLGNCFRTRKDAEFALEKQKVYTELKRYALEHNEYAIDWSNLEQKKWEIIYDYEFKSSIRIIFTTSWCKMGAVYFTSAEIARNAIAEIGEEKIKKYLFEVEE